ncbi:hypothetical protein EBS80_00015 [bacterium]|nr:hypothetical protein [bacterium]
MTRRRTTRRPIPRRTTPPRIRLSATTPRSTPAPRRTTPGTEDTGTEDTGPTYTDGDADGWSVEGGDCDDADATVNPAAIETANDGVDNDCDGVALVTETDADSDGYGVSVDCDDTDAAINPGAAEVCDGVDQNCDGTADEGVTTHVYRDADGDGYGDELSGTDACGVPSGYVTTVYDCNESDASIHTGATEIPNDGIDQDCDSADLVVEADADSDGYSESADCDDSDATVNPGATETLDGVDQDCDGTVDNDTGIEGYILATYPSSKTLQMNAQVYWDASELGSWWDESSASTVGEDVDVTLTTAEYGDLTGSCGVRFNVSEGSPARDWLCVGGSVDSSVDLDVYYDGTWYDESDIEVWDAGYGDGSCSAILIVSTDADCQI